MQLDAVVFDLHGTLIPWSKSQFRAMLSEMASTLAVPDDEFARVMGEDAHEAMLGKLGSVMTRTEQICGQLGVPASDDQLERASGLWTDFHWQGYENPYPGALSTLQRLREMGLKIGLITNCGSEAPELWPRTEFAPLVDVTVFSSVDGLMKPDSRIYERVSECLGVRSEQCLYVDDSVACLAGAAEVGMQPVLIRHADNTVGLDGVDQWTGPLISSLVDVLQYTGGRLRG